jgi:hypothetical protein
MSAKHSYTFTYCISFNTWIPEPTLREAIERRKDGESIEHLADDLEIPYPTLRYTLMRLGMVGKPYKHIATESYCKECGRLFNGSTRQKYCCPACRKSHDYQRRVATNGKQYQPRSRANVQ